MGRNGCIAGNAWRLGRSDFEHCVCSATLSSLRKVTYIYIMRVLYAENGGVSDDFIDNKLEPTFIRTVA
jgi:hypothetical protein